MSHPKLIIAISPGFTQHESTQTGVRRIAKELRKRLDDNDVLIIDRTWDADWTDIGKRMVQEGSASTKYVFVGHSYGGGVAFPQYAEALARHSRDIDLAFLIDPVPRFWSNPIRASLGVLLNAQFGQITLPKNVIRCLSWRQRNDWPIGRPVVGAVKGVVYGPTARKCNPRDWESLYLNRTLTHSTIDDYVGIRSVVIREVMSLQGTT